MKTRRFYFRNKINSSGMKNISVVKVKMSKQTENITVVKVNMSKWMENITAVKVNVPK